MIEKICKFCGKAFSSDKKNFNLYCNSKCKSKDKFVKLKQGGKTFSVWKLNYEKFPDFYNNLPSGEERHKNMCYICGKVYDLFRMCCSDECSLKMKKMSTLMTTGAEHNLSSSSSSRKNMNENLFNRYGVNNVFQREDVKNKLKETWKMKYGFSNPSKSEEIKEKKRKIMEERGYWMSREEWDDRKIYEANVYEITWSQMKRFAKLKFGNDIWKRIEESRNLSQVEWLTVDHRFSRNSGFLNSVSPEIIGHICNLEILTFSENRLKWANSSVSMEDLLEEIEKFDKITKI